MKYLKNRNKYVVRIDKGEEVIEQIRKVCIQNNIKAGAINGIGTTERFKVGLFNTKTKKYSSKELVGSFEIVSLIGNISRMSNEVYLHIHMGASDENMNLYGGHLNYCYISGTCEIVIDEIYLDVDRKHDPEVGLNLYEM